MIEAAHDEAWEVLVEYRDVLDALVLRLLDKETVARKEVLELFATVQKRPDPRYLHRLRQAAAVRQAAGHVAQGARARRELGVGLDGIPGPTNGQVLGYGPGTEGND